jgi:poly(3-hydroxybutyrate) depolymerase
MHCVRIAAHRRVHYVQKGVGHGVFNGSRSVNRAAHQRFAISTANKKPALVVAAE